MMSTTQIFIALHQQPNKTANDIFHDNMHIGEHYFQDVMWCHRTCLSVISLTLITKVWPPSTALYCTETHKCATVWHVALLHRFSRKMDNKCGKHGFQRTHFYTTHDISINLCGHFLYQFLFIQKWTENLKIAVKKFHLSLYIKSRFHSNDCYETYACSTELCTNLLHQILPILAKKCRKYG